MNQKDAQELWDAIVGYAEAAEDTADEDHVATTGAEEVDRRFVAAENRLRTLFVRATGRVPQPVDETVTAWVVE